MAKGDWLELPFTVLGGVLRGVLKADFSIFEVVLILLGIGLFLWFAAIRNRLLPIVERKDDALVRYSYGACLLIFLFWFICNGCALAVLCMSGNCAST